MPYFETSYETTIGKIFDTKKLDHALREKLITNAQDGESLGIEPTQTTSVLFIYNEGNQVTPIPAFVHPYLVRDKKASQGKNVLASDMRFFKTKSDTYISGKEFEATVRNKVEYQFVKNRTLLNLLWLEPNLRSFRSQFAFAGYVFATWLSQIISRTYSLDFRDQLRIVAVGLYYYYSLFTKESRRDSELSEIAIIHTIKATKFPASEIMALFDTMGEIHGIADYCTEVQRAVENVRMKDFNLAMLLTLIRNSWYGLNAKDILSVALEHPPTWIAVVFATIADRTYKSSALFKVVESQMKRHNSAEFELNCLEMVKTNIMALESIDDAPIVFRDFED